MSLALEDGHIVDTWYEADAVLLVFSARIVYRGGMVRNVDALNGARRRAHRRETRRIKPGKNKGIRLKYTKF